MEERNLLLQNVHRFLTGTFFFEPQVAQEQDSSGLLISSKLAKKDDLHERAAQAEDPIEQLKLQLEEVSEQIFDLQIENEDEDSPEMQALLQKETKLRQLYYLSQLEKTDELH